PLLVGRLTTALMPSSSPRAEMMQTNSTQPESSSTRPQYQVNPKEAVSTRPAITARPVARMWLSRPIAATIAAKRSQPEPSAGLVWYQPPRKPRLTRTPRMVKTTDLAMVFPLVSGQLCQLPVEMRLPGSGLVSSPCAVAMNCGPDAQAQHCPQRLAADCRDAGRAARHESPGP